jgi:hypothetical protein
MEELWPWECNDNITRFLIFHFKSKDNANLVIEKGPECSEEDFLSSNCGTHILFLTKIKFQRCSYGFISRVYFLHFEMTYA